MENTSATTQKPSLYERLGGEQGLRKIVNDILDKNFSNPKISHHFKNVDMNKLKQLVFEFFSMGTGGPHIYTGRDMRSAHAHLGISQRDFSLGNDDVSEALKENGVSKAEIDEVIGILNSMKGDVVTV
ncbi:group I truncated hemoglobin [Terrimonas pollutisoli]|jgi:truncated hemoglobin YjbI|uniref:group I truncated hemoglobin n=1 Tax=Terrimonas pollutisoli TaxID=3034147 RepID=UPI0023EBBA9C|nr:group 1 truncated hemoglobin [Terrimonas sp. H1YJ31]